MFLHGIQNIQTSHHSNIIDKLQGGMIYNNHYPILEGPLGTGSSYLGAICQNLLGCTYLHMRVHFILAISSFRVSNQVI
jgi:hypothetical protein